MPVTNRKLFGAAALALVGLCALVGFLSFTDFSQAPALGRKEREAKKNQTESIDRKHTDDMKDSIADEHEDVASNTGSKRGRTTSSTAPTRMGRDRRSDDMVDRSRKDDEGEKTVPARIDDSVLSTPVAAHPNKFCIGNQQDHVSDPTKDGQGYICNKALLKPKCETHEQLSSLYCACCHCFKQCNLRETDYIGCQREVNCQ